MALRHVPHAYFKRVDFFLSCATFLVGKRRKAKGAFYGIKVREFGRVGGRDYYFREFRWRADIEVKLSKDADWESGAHPCVTGTWWAASICEARGRHRCSVGLYFGTLKNNSILENRDPSCIAITQLSQMALSPRRRCLLLLCLIAIHYSHAAVQVSSQQWLTRPRSAARLNCLICVSL